MAAQTPDQHQPATGHHHHHHHNHHHPPPPPHLPYYHRLLSFHLSTSQVASAAAILLLCSSFLLFVSFNLQSAAPGKWKCQRGMEEEQLAAAERQYEANLAKRMIRLRNKTPEPPFSGWGIRPVKEIFFVPMYPCPSLQRFGAWGEGGKWVCSHSRFFPEKPIIYSIGSKGETSFEEDIADAFNAKVFTFDPFLDGDMWNKVSQVGSIEFHAIGLSGRKDMAAYRNEFPKLSFLTTEELLGQMRHKRVDVFKMDCEGCEVGVVGDWAKRFTRESFPFSQVLMEFHFALNSNITLNLMLWMESLGLALFHVEENGWQTNCYEFAYIHESMFKTSLRP